MAISRATGAKFLGKFSVEETGPVIMFTAENSEESLHRRITKVVTGLKMRGEWPINGDALLQNLYVVPTLGINMRLLHVDRFNRGYSSMVNQLISSISEIEGCPLIFIDPISRFMGGDENDADTATRFMEALEFIAKKTNCCTYSLRIM
jgi:RecA-family ATPase